MLVRVYGRVVHPHGVNETTPITGDGVIEYVRSGVGRLDGAVHGGDRHRVAYAGGVVEDDYLAPGEWLAYVYPSKASEQGRSYSMTLGIPETGEITLADALGVVVDNTIITRGEKGDTGNSAYQTAIDNGFDGTETEWLASLHGQDGHSPDLSWDGTALVVDGEPGPDLTGPQGPPVPDTGWRDVSTILDSGYRTLNPNAVGQIRRYGPRVYINLRQGTSATAAGAFAPVLRLPAGFRCETSTRTWGATSLEENTGKPVRDDGTIYLGGRDVLSTFAVPAKRYAFTIEFFTPDAWPTSLPGDAA